MRISPTKLTAFPLLLVLLFFFLLPRHFTPFVLLRSLFPITPDSRLDEGTPFPEGAEILFILTVRFLGASIFAAIGCILSYPFFHHTPREWLSAFARGVTLTLLGGLLGLMVLLLVSNMM